jgi:hypothetical protein
MKQLAERRKKREPTRRVSYRLEQTYLDKLERIRVGIGLPDTTDALRYAITQANRLVR